MADEKKKLTIAERIVSKKEEITRLENKYKEILNIADQTKQQGFELIGQLKLLEGMLADEGISATPKEVVA